MLTILLAYSVIAQDAFERPQEKNTSCMAVCKVDMLMMNASASFEKSSGTSSDIGPAGDQALTRAAGLVPIACMEKMKVSNCTGCTSCTITVLAVLTTKENC